MANEMDSKLLSWIDARTTDKSATCGVVASGSHTLVRPLLLASLMVNALAGPIIFVIALIHNSSDPIDVITPVYLDGMNA